MLACGAIETPRLLLLERGLRTAVNASGQVGRNFMESVAWTSIGRVEEPLLSFGGLPADAIAWQHNRPDAVPGELGIGYGFQGQAFLLNGAVRVPYATVGTDYLIGKGWQPYVGVHSLGRARSPGETSTTSCPTGFDLVNGACQSTSVD